MSQLDQLLSFMQQGGAEVTGINLRWVLQQPVTTDDFGNATVFFSPAFRTSCLGVGVTFHAEQGQPGDQGSSSGGKVLGIWGLNRLYFILKLANSSDSTDWKNLSVKINYLAIGVD